MFLACDMSELFHTRDLGASWAPVHFAEFNGNRESAVRFTSDPDVLYALDYSLVNLEDRVTPARSADGGATWTHLAGRERSAGARRRGPVRTSGPSAGHISRARP
ncbi:MAG: hypothetical protein HUU26_13510 [Gemmatimonadaceae bacterium]|nr:hypothetical protein [Gemmatimonadaceae bacterium]